MRTTMLALVLAALVLPIAASPAVAQSQAAAAGPVYVVYYWRAKPDKLADYSAYITGTAEKIDEDARKAGAFIDVTTVLATRTPEGSLPDWTHLRMFKVASVVGAEQLGAALDAATIRMVPDEAQRKANSARSAGMRDFVRREVWTTLR